MRPRFHPGVLAVIAVGGAAGTLGRAALAYALPPSPHGFPWSTFIANVVGSLALGLIVVAALERVAPSRYFRPLLATGLCGGLTTFSTLVVETDLLVKNGQVGTAAVYVVASVVAALAVVRVGMLLARAAWGGEGS
jgi:fluoride exporter